MKTPKRKSNRPLWVCRNLHHSGLYCVYGRKPLPKKRFNIGGEWTGYCNYIDPSDFESIFGLKLKPGEGPKKMVVKGRWV